MEDKVTLFGNIAHNLAEDVERILILTEADSENPLKFYSDYAVMNLTCLENIARNEYDYDDTLVTLKNLAEAGMAGHQYALDGNTHVSGLANQMTDLYARKNRDYGNSFDKSMDKFGLVVAAIRIGDKVNRLQSLVSKRGVAEVKDESIADTFMDLACYSIMTMMWLFDKEKDIIHLPDDIEIVLTEQPPKHNASPEEIHQIKKDYGIQD